MLGSSKEAYSNHWADVIYQLVLLGNALQSWAFLCIHGILPYAGCTGMRVQNVVMLGSSICDLILPINICAAKWGRIEARLPGILVIHRTRHMKDDQVGGLCSCYRRQLWFIN